MYTPRGSSSAEASAFAEATADKTADRGWPAERVRGRVKWVK